MRALKKAGIKDTELFRAVNDTTAAALKTGRLLAGYNGTCVIHEVQLVMQHAIGIKNRTVDHVVVDEFDACEAIRKEIRNSASYLMEKKSKKLYAHYVEFCQSKSLTSIKINLPNSTRVLGTHLLIEECVRRRWNLILH